MNAKSLKNWQGTTAVIGVDFGDSGKGRLVDDLSASADIVARYNGGSNAGHTVENQHGKFAFHIIPSGIFNSKASCLVGRNVAVDLPVLIRELEILDKASIAYNRLFIDSQASLIMPWHKMRDGLREKLRQDGKIGTTGQGIGPVYADRAERTGILVGDLISPDFKKKLKDEIKIQNQFYKLKLDFGEIYKQYSQYAKKIKPLIGNTTQILTHAKNTGKNILFEGAQGYFLDIDAGTYPYVTSSNPGIVGIIRCFDLHPSDITEVIGITKAYTTRVGAGPMPTEIDGEIAQTIIEKGQEFGTTTGRVRRPGWLDLVLVKAAHAANHLTVLAITKLDILSYLPKIKLCVGYKLNGRKVDYFPHNAQLLSQAKPIYEELPAWQENISSVRDFKKLPTNAQNYVKRIEEVTKIPVKFISVGPKRGEIIYK